MHNKKACDHNRNHDFGTLGLEGKVGKVRLGKNVLPYPYHPQMFFIYDSSSR